MGIHCSGMGSMKADRPMRMLAASEVRRVSFTLTILFKTKDKLLLLIVVVVILVVSVFQIHSKTFYIDGMQWLS